MKIICNKDEFAELVRECTLLKVGDKCWDCLFSAMCTNDADCTEEGYIMNSIEDICEIEVGAGG